MSKFKYGYESAAASNAPHGLRVRQSFKVTNPEHANTGQAGVIQAVYNDFNFVGVEFDENPGEVVEVRVIDGQALGAP